MWGVSGLQVHRIRSCRLLYKDVVEVRSNYKKFYFWWFGNPACGKSTGSNQIEKDQGCVSARLVRGKKGENGQCDLVRAECLQMIVVTGVMLMVFFMCDELVPILRNGCKILIQNYVALFQENQISAGLYSRNLI